MGQWIALGMAVLVILGLTFVLGLLVGRQWARQTPSAAATESAKKAAAGRSGLAEAGIERPPELGKRLTFYQTLTAPLTSAPSASKSGSASRPEPPPKPQAAPVAVPAPAPPVDEVPPRIAEPAPVPAPSLPPPAADRPMAATAASQPPGQWTVQVAAFKGRDPAERLQRQMASAGFDAYVTEKGGEGQAQFRVRVGSFKTREEAVRLAERIKAERSLAGFVTAR
jgi:cell division septation protein DedD